MTIDTSKLDAILQKATKIQQDARASYQEFKNDPTLSDQGRRMKAAELSQTTSKTLLDLKSEYLTTLNDIRNNTYTNLITEGLLETSSGKASVAAAMSKIQPVLVTLNGETKASWIGEMADFSRLTDDKAMTVALRLIADKKGGSIQSELSNSDPNYQGLKDQYRESTKGLPDPDRDALIISAHFVNPISN